MFTSPKSIGGLIGYVKESEFILFTGVCLSPNILMYVNNKHQPPFWSQQQISTSHIAGG